MKNILTLILSILFSFQVKSQLNDWIWAINGQGSESDIIRSSITDNSGNLYVAGFFNSPTLTIGGVVTTKIQNNYNAFVAKISSTGQVIWAKNFYAEMGYYQIDLTITTDNSLYVYGSYKGASIIFDAITITNHFAGTEDLFLFKLDLNGTVTAGQSIGDSGNETGKSIVADNNGNICFTGTFDSDFFQIGSQIAYRDTSFDWCLITPDIFIAKVDQNLNALWIKRAGGETNEKAEDLAIDQFDNIYLTGAFRSQVFKFDHLMFLNPTSAAVSEDPFLIKIDPAGSALWGYSTGDGATINNTGTSLAVDGNSNVYMLGRFNASSIQFGSYTMINQETNKGWCKLFLTKFDSTGTLLWAKSSTGNGNDYTHSIFAADDNSVFISVSFYSPFIFDYYTANASGLFLSRIQPDGSLSWATSIPNSDFASFAFSKNTNEIYASGRFTGSSVSFGSHLLNNSSNNQTYGEVYVSKLSQLVDISEVKTTDDILMYPNPSCGELNLSIKNTHSWKYRLVDALGKIIMEGTSFNSNKTIDCSYLRKGLYFVNIEIGNVVKSECVVIN